MSRLPHSAMKVPGGVLSKSGVTTDLAYEKQRVNGICVRDHGVGIGKYDLGKIFDPFYSSKNSNSNWGLGLYLSLIHI